MRATVAILIAAGFQFGWVAGASAVPIGKAEAVIPSTSDIRAGATRDLVINEAVEQDDLIRTTRNGSTQIRFIDDTMLTVAPNAEIVVDKAIFDASQAKSLSVTLQHGAMRFVSGLSSRESYEVKTPIATIGVRGTVVDILQEDNRTIVNFVMALVRSASVRRTSVAVSQQASLHLQSTRRDFRRRPPLRQRVCGVGSTAPI